MSLPIKKLAEVFVSHHSESSLLTRVYEDTISPRMCSRGQRVSVIRAISVSKIPFKIHVPWS